ncbi:MAG: ABC transporter permease [Actinomycetota bacterium]|nr:ABC transporter permease [Actinomycetota bacterium]
MSRRPRGHFWVESALSLLAVVTTLVTLVWKDWVEKVFGLDPDGHNGAVEWLIVGAVLVAAVTLAGLARAEWRLAPVLAADRRT